MTQRPLVPILALLVLLVLLPTAVAQLTDLNTRSAVFPKDIVKFDDPFPDDEDEHGDDDEDEDGIDLTAPVNLDVDGDGDTDFAFDYDGIQSADVPPSAATEFLEVIATTGNRLLRTGSGGFLPFPLGSVISGDVDPPLSWSPSGGEPPPIVHLASRNWSLSGGWDEEWHGPWAGITAMYLPIEIAVEGVPHYGWIQMSFDQFSGILTIHDFAYNPVAGADIVAGAGS